MRAMAVLLAALSTAVLLSGCPFESKVPVGNPAPGSIDSRLLGFWSGTEVKEGDSLEVLILPFNDAEYFVEVTEAGESPEHYRAYAIPMAGEQVLQVNEVTPEGAPAGYVLARYSLADNAELQVRFVGEKIVPKALEADPAGLLEFVSGHLGDPALNDEDVELHLHPVARED